MKSLQLTKPHMLVVVGLPGSGKSFFAAKFSDAFKAPYIDFDYYARTAGDYNAGIKLANHALDQLQRTKQTIVVEGRGMTRSDRDNLILTAYKAGYDTLFIWVQTDPNTAEDRAVHSKTATLSLSEFDQLVSQFENLVAGEPYMVISGRHTFASQGRTVLKRLTGPRPAVEPTVLRQARNRSRNGRISV